jgi:cobalt-zinc-cadmium efflux system protein
MAHPHASPDPHDHGQADGHGPHGHAGGHDHTRGASTRALWLALCLTGGFMLVEVAGGLLTGSLALLSDAAHMMTDTAALGIGLLAQRMVARPADARRSFGYGRFEVLAAAFNAVLLLFVAAYILYEAWQRIREPAEIASLAMLGVAAVGLVVNLLSMRALGGGKDDNLNMRGAYLEVWSDMLGSAGVIAAALVIRFTGWLWVDSLVAVGIGLWVLPRTWTLLRQSVNLLLEGVPEHLSVPQIEAALLAVPGVSSVHELHVWAVASGQVSVALHAVHGAQVHDPQALLTQLRQMLAERFALHHSTIQLEAKACEQAEGAHSYGPAS